MKQLVVVATRREARALGSSLEPFVCGSGPAAGEAVAARIARDRPGLLLLAGWCGGLDPSLGPGAIILGRQAMMVGAELLEPDRLMMEDIRHQLHAKKVPFAYSRLITVSEPAASKIAKRDLWNEHGAGGVDLETWYVAQAAARARVPWAAVRVVVDASNQSLPAPLARWDGEASERKIFLATAAKPAEWPGMARLALRMPAVSKSLRRATIRVLAAARKARTVETLDLVEV